jgi:hypothetical protein
VTVHKLSLDRDNNEDFYKLADEHNSIMGCWNLHNSLLCKIKTGRIFPFRARYKIKDIGKNIKKLQDEFLDLNKRASDFLMRPHYKIDPTQRGDMVFLYFTAILQYLIGHLDSRMVMLAENYNKVYLEYQHRIDFLIAIGAFIVSLVGLIIAIIK